MATSLAGLTKELYQNMRQRCTMFEHVIAEATWRKCTCSGPFKACRTHCWRDQALCRLPNISIPLGSEGAFAIWPSAIQTVLCYATRAFVKKSSFWFCDRHDMSLYLADSRFVDRSMNRQLRCVAATRYSPALWTDEHMALLSRRLVRTPSRTQAPSIFSCHSSAPPNATT